MAMTNAMNSVLYEYRNFLQDPRADRHPLRHTDKHIFYHLYRDEEGCLAFTLDAQGNRISTPRSLGEMCVHTMVCNVDVMENYLATALPTNLHPIMLSEAIYHRESQPIEWLVSTWPMRVLRIYDLVPLEDYVEDDYLTSPLDEGSNMCIADCLIAGLLKLQPHAGLRYVDFRGFDNDRKLGRELCRLPILWMEPDMRQVDHLHDIMSDTLDVSKDKVERFLNRIDVVYSNVDSEFKHGNKIGPVTILLDLNINIDDVPLGLSLVRETPFKFLASRIWMKRIAEVCLQPDSLSKVLDATRITHFEFEDQKLPGDDERLQALLDGLPAMRHLYALSLPSSIDVNDNQEMARSINTVLRKICHLQRLNFSYCNLGGQLTELLDGLQQRFVYLNLTDCRLVDRDINFLTAWRPLAYLRELNLSNNTLSNFESQTIRMLERMRTITCFAVCFCALNTHSLVLIARQCKECTRLKVIGMQTYAPLPVQDVLEILSIASRMRRLQKVLIFPGVYAYPGSSVTQREEQRIHLLVTSYRYLAMRSRGDIQLE